MRWEEKKCQRLIFTLTTNIYTYKITNTHTQSSDKISVVIHYVYSRIKRDESPITVDMRTHSSLSNRVKAKASWSNGSFLRLASIFTRVKPQRHTIESGIYRLWKLLESLLDDDDDESYTAERWGNHIVTRVRRWRSRPRRRRLLQKIERSHRKSNFLIDASSSFFSPLSDFFLSHLPLPRVYIHFHFYYHRWLSRLLCTRSFFQLVS